jgi:putative protease
LNTLEQRAVDESSSTEVVASTVTNGCCPVVIADFSINVTNSLSALELLRRNVQVFTPSYDLDAAQLEAMLDSPLAPHAEVVVYHPMPLFHMEHCVIAARLSSGRSYRDCGRPCERHQVSLRDRTGLLLPVEADVGCRNTVFHGRAQAAVEQVTTLIAQGVSRFRVELVRENAQNTTVLVRSFRELIDGIGSPSQVRQRLTAAGLSVVRGSLRVVG